MPLNAYPDIPVTASISFHIYSHTLLQIILEIIQKPILLQLLEFPPLSQTNTVLSLGIQYYFRIFVCVEASAVEVVDLGSFKEDYVSCQGIECVDIAPYYRQIVQT